jgi:exopolysaccharide biosynthesis polyprenyl glycosylphosphotransferase
MIPSRRHIVNHLMKIFDLFVLAASFGFATVVLNSSATEIRLAALLSIPIRLDNILLFGGILIVWHELFSMCGLYVSKRLTRRRDQISEVCKATLLSTAILIIWAKLFHIAMIRSTMIFSVSFWIFCTLVMITGRMMARSLLIALRRNGKNRRFILIVGTNERARRFAAEVTERREFGYDVVGFVDDDWSGIEMFETKTAQKRCCTFGGLADFLRHSVVDEAAIYLPLRSYYEHASQLVSLCEQHGIGIRYDPQIFNRRSLQTNDQTGTQTRLPNNSYPEESGQALAKRFIDCILSGTLLIFFAPLFVIVAALVKLTSPGPIFFSQARVGLNKRQFKMYKFRTMVANAEQLQEQLAQMNEMSGPAFKIKHDPRVTPLGRALRKSSIDELPQLLNVLIGDMSLVGPRAMSMRDYKLFDQDWQRRRFSVKPGITCLWQVAGRSSLPFDKWMELDMQYIDKWSLWLDLKILVRTVPAVLRGTGAA